MYSHVIARIGNFPDKLLAALFCLVLSCAPLFAEKRVALVIGNSNYISTTELKNPFYDATDIATVLKRLNFDVIQGLDLDNNGMRDALKDFSARIQSADVALFFYAGHALQVDGVNYLAPVDTALRHKTDLEFETVSLDLVLRKMELNAKTVLVFLDACRDNPLATRLVPTGRTLNAVGLAQPKASPGGAFIAFATSPGSVAFDGDGRNSPFTASLLKNIERPGVELNALMIDVRVEVHKVTQQQQLPWTNTALLGRFYFKSGETEVAVEPEPDPEEVAELNRIEALKRQLEVWDAIRNTREPELVQQFLEKYPDGKLAKVAALKLEQLRLLEEVLTPNQPSEGVVEGEGQEPVNTGDKLQTASLPEPQTDPDSGLIDPEPENIEQLARSVQTELNRIGCDAGNVDGIWGPKGRKSLERYSTHGNVQFASTEPTRKLLNELLTRQGRVCPLVCGVKFVKQGDQCIKKTCASGLVLNSRGSCVKKTVQKTSTVEKKSRNPVSRPAWCREWPEASICHQN